MAVNEEELRRYLNVVKRAVDLIEGMLENDDGGMMEQLMQPQSLPTPQQVAPKPKPEPIPQQVAPKPEPIPQPQPQPQPVPDVSMNRKKHVGDLMAIDCWPEAVPAFLVSAEISDEDQINRANAVLDMMVDRNMENGTLLDFGCGEGWIAQEASKRGLVETIGYDIVAEDNWNNRSGAKFTSNFDNIPKDHFDYVMLYDVLDHCEDPVEAMTQVKSVLKPGGAIFVRCHPWPSRHAMHLYKQGLNQAYLHLFLTWNELNDLIDGPPVFTRTETDPIKAYHWWFDGLNIIKERFVREDVSEFFFVPSFKELLANEQQIDSEHIDGFLDTMRISFVDYVLEK